MQEILSRPHASESNPFAGKIGSGDKIVLVVPHTLTVSISAVGVDTASSQDKFPIRSRGHFADISEYVIGAIS
jgi:hypothetical protein